MPRLRLVHRSPRGASAPDRQRGSILVPAAFAILVGVVLLGAAQLGYVFYMKRELQNAADLAALSSVQVLNAIDPARCDPAMQAARVSAQANFPTMAGPLADADFDALKCARWDPAHWASAKGGGAAKTDPTQLYIFQPSAGENLNAMHVRLKKSLPPIFPNPFGSNAPVVATAEAVATTTPPVAAFSVGSQLLRTKDDAPLMNILKLVGVPLDASLLDYKGLATLKITPAGLLAALGLSVDTDLVAGSGDSLVSAKKISLGALLAAAISVAEKGGNALAKTQIVALQSALALSSKVKLDDLTIDLFGDDSRGGLFGHITSGTRDAGLNAQVDALGLMSNAIAVANVAVADGSNALSLGGNIPGVTLKAFVVEPPAVGVGGVGTTAYNAQVRLYLHIDFNPDSVPLLKPLLEPLDLRVNLSAVVDLIDGYGVLTKLDCSTATRRAEITVTSAVMHACMGKIDTEADVFSKTDMCSAMTTGENIVTLQGIPLVSPPIHFDIPALASTSSLSFSVDAANPLPQMLPTPNPLPLGNTMDSLTYQLENVVDKVAAPVSSKPEGDVAAQLALSYLNAVPKTSLGRYDVDATINLLKNGTALGASKPLAPLGDWTVTSGVPYGCHLLNLDTCWKDGSVYTAFKSSVTGAGKGLLGGVLGTLLGGLVVKDCSGLVSQLLSYNACVANNLASYLRTSPTGLSSGDAAGGSGKTCGLLCTLLKPAVDALVPVLNGTGSLLSALTSNVLGLQTGVTDVTLMSLSCAKPRLVF